MQPERTVSTDTIEKISQELLGLDIDTDHREAVAGLLNGLAEDMQALRNMNVGSEEPAVIYEAVQR